jgi:hypothetical protein
LFSDAAVAGVARIGSKKKGNKKGKGKKKKGSPGAAAVVSLESNVDVAPPGEGVPAFPPLQSADTAVDATGQPVPGFDAGQPAPGFDAGQPAPGFDAGQPVPGYEAEQPGYGFEAGPSHPRLHVPVDDFGDEVDGPEHRERPKMTEKRGGKQIRKERLV